MKPYEQHPKKARVLANHKKDGKNYIPPMMQLQRIEFARWVDHILPELIWLALLQDRLGLKRGIDVAIMLAHATSHIAERETILWYAPLSAYEQLTEKEQAAIVALLAEQGILESLCEGLWPLLQFYPKCPLNFIAKSRLPIIHDPQIELRDFKVCLASLFDRKSKEATFVQTTAIYIAFLTDKLKLACETQLDDLSVIEQYPTTDKSISVASSVRALMNALQQDICNKSSWSLYFWNRGLEIEQCELRV